VENGLGAANNRSNRSPGQGGAFGGAKSQTGYSERAVWIRKCRVARFQIDVSAWRQDRQIQYGQAFLETPRRRNWLCLDSLWVPDQHIRNDAKLMAKEIEIGEKRILDFFQSDPIDYQEESRDEVQRLRSLSSGRPA
jgi:hypothetical protein